MIACTSDCVSPLPARCSALVATAANPTSPPASLPPACDGAVGGAGPADARGEGACLVARWQAAGSRLADRLLGPGVKGNSGSASQGPEFAAPVEVPGPCVAGWGARPVVHGPPTACGWGAKAQALCAPATRHGGAYNQIGYICQERTPYRLLPSWVGGSSNRTARSSALQVYRRSRFAYNCNRTPCCRTVREVEG